MDVASPLAPCLQLRRMDLQRVCATPAWLWPWQAQWLCAGREIRGSQAVCRFSSVLYGCYQVAPLCLTSPLSETKIIHHHTELFVSTKKTKVLTCYRMGGYTQRCNRSISTLASVLVGIIFGKSLAKCTGNTHKHCCNVRFFVPFSPPEDEFCRLCYFLGEYLPCKYITVLHTLCFDLIQESEQHSDSSEYFIHHFVSDFLT